MSTFKKIKIKHATIADKIYIKESDIEDLDSLTISANRGIEQGENFLSNVVFGEGVGALDFSRDKINKVGKTQAMGTAQEKYVSTGDYNTNPNQTSTGSTVSSSVAAGA